MQNCVDAIRTYFVKSNYDGVIVRIVYDVGKCEQYIFSVNDNGSYNDKTITGAQAYYYVEKQFKHYYHKSLFTAFSGMNYKDQYMAIKKCVPKQISWIYRNAIHRIIRGCYKADVSSAYPYEGSKLLPTLHDSKKVKGESEPSQEYPFAFYTKSHHLAIYGELDTRTWKDRKKWYSLYDEMYEDIDPNENETILCKASEYTLHRTFEDIYHKKINGDKLAKLGMNACIGYFQKNSSPKLSHLSAVIIARCCQRMMDLSDKLEKEGNPVVFIATDSLIWTGSYSDIATEDKYLGSFTYEYKNVKFYGLGPKAYQLELADGEVVTKYAGMKNGKEKDALEFAKLPELKGQSKYIVDKETGRITIIDYGL